MGAPPRRDGQSGNGGGGRGGAWRGGGSAAGAASACRAPVPQRRRDAAAAAAACRPPVWAPPLRKSVKEPVGTEVEGLRARAEVDGESPQHWGGKGGRDYRGQARWVCD